MNTSWGIIVSRLVYLIHISLDLHACIALSRPTCIAFAYRSRSRSHPSIFRPARLSHCGAREGRLGTVRDRKQRHGSTKPTFYSIITLCAVLPAFLVLFPQGPRATLISSNVLAWSSELSRRVPVRVPGARPLWLASPSKYIKSHISFHPSAHRKPWWPFLCRSSYIIVLLQHVVHVPSLHVIFGRADRKLWGCSSRCWFCRPHPHAQLPGMWMWVPR